MLSRHGRLIADQVSSCRQAGPHGTPIRVAVRGCHSPWARSFGSNRLRQSSTGLVGPRGSVRMIRPRGHHAQPEVPVQATGGGRRVTPKLKWGRPHFRVGMESEWGHPHCRSRREWMAPFDPILAALAAVAKLEWGHPHCRSRREWMVPTSFEWVESRSREATLVRRSSQTTAPRSDIDMLKINGHQLRHA
jgi:hypothetical protein